MEKLKELWRRWQRSRGGRALQRYSDRGGSVLCGGMAYTALFSLFAALTIGFTVFSGVLGRDAELSEQALAQVEEWVPGLVDTGSGGLVRPEQLMLSGGFSLTSVVAVLVLLWSATAVMGALRVSVRTMFDLPVDRTSPVVEKLLQLAGFVLLLAGVLVAAATGVLVSTAAPWVLDQFGMAGASRVVVRVLGLVASVVVDAVVVALVIRFVAGVRLPARELYVAAAVVGVTTGLLRWAGSSLVVGSAAQNALLAGFAVLVSVLVLVNVVARVLLLASAWAAEANGRQHDHVEAPAA
ncbi:YihY/virulence factor BrkB family protein [Myceligenerans crystallogenes]|uniref:YihY family inner membrane protein n=1 Tax=Myceligenerans crystallogenes TaxID=316335 RepID=A0ABN2N635_9MICO